MRSLLIRPASSSIEKTPRRAHAQFGRPWQARTRRSWPEQVLPLGLARMMLITPSGWTLTESSREVRLPEETERFAFDKDVYIIVRSIFEDCYNHRAARRWWRRRYLRLLARWRRSLPSQLMRASTAHRHRRDVEGVAIWGERESPVLGKARRTGQDTFGVD